MASDYPSEEGPKTERRRDRAGTRHIVRDKEGWKIEEPWWLVAFKVWKRKKQAKSTTKGELPSDPHILHGAFANKTQFNSSLCQFFLDPFFWTPCLFVCLSICLFAALQSHSTLTWPSPSLTYLKKTRNNLEFYPIQSCRARVDHTRPHKSRNGSSVLYAHSKPRSKHGQ